LMIVSRIPIRAARSMLSVTIQATRAVTMVPPVLHVIAFKMLLKCDSIGLCSLIPLL
jgi:hypothetical protein